MLIVETEGASQKCESRSDAEGACALKCSGCNINHCHYISTEAYRCACRRCGGRRSRVVYRCDRSAFTCTTA